MPPKQQEILNKIIVGKIDDLFWSADIDSEKLATYLASLESRVEDVESVLTPTQKIQIAENKKKLSTEVL